jgi:flagellar P-ring protein precursor FlgI
MKTFSALVLILALSTSIHAQTRIKDIAHISGVRTNSLVGYGLVIGLNKTGDKKQTLFPQQTLVNMLEQFGLTLNGNVRVENIAGVIVTADIPAFARPGSPIDVTVSSIGDATSLQGGVLLRTPLNGADGQTYALAGGSLVLGGYSAGNAATGITVNHPTVGRIPNGGMVERAITVGAPQVVETLDLILDQMDFTNVGRVVNALNASFGGPIASPVDGRSVRMLLPSNYQRKWVDFVAVVENVNVQVDTKAKIVVDERTGTVVIGSDVTLAPVSIAHGSLSIQIDTQFNVSQPMPYSLGQTTTVPQTSVRADEQQSNFVTLKQGATVDDLIRALNSLGVTPRDTIAILEAIKAAGALNAELQIL